MSFFLIILSLAVVVVYISWILFKPKKQTLRKKAAIKKKPALKNKNSATNQKSPTSATDPITRKKAEQMRKDPEIVSQVIRHWLNEK